MLHFAVLGSGSSGNSAVVCAGEARVLIDAGLSARQLKLRLESLGIDPESISGIVLTHEHGDHARGIDVFCRKRPVPVYATAHTAQVVREGMRSSVPWQIFEAGDSFRVGGLEVDSFSVPHDAIDPVGYIFRGQQSSLGVLSDIGHVTPVVRDRLQSVDTLFVESNYDEVMLQNDTKRPWSTKQRISSRHGHLSNTQTAELVVSLATQAKRLHRVVLGHLSGDCNAPAVARKSIGGALREAGFSEIEVDCADQKTPLPLRSTIPAFELAGSDQGQKGTAGADAPIHSSLPASPENETTPPGPNIQGKSLPASFPQGEKCAESATWSQTELAL